MSSFSIPGGVFWGYFGNDIPIFILGYLVTYATWRYHNKCYDCWRHGKYPYKHKKYCKSHHPVENGSISIKE